MLLEIYETISAPELNASGILPTRRHSHGASTRHLFIIPSPLHFNINQMSAASTSKKAGESSNPADQKTQENLPNLGVLEEDDEFEEFAVAGQEAI
jgi:hypothetical protein